MGPPSFGRGGKPPGRAGRLKPWAAAADHSTIARWLAPPDQSPPDFHHEASCGVDPPQEERWRKAAPPLYFCAASRALASTATSSITFKTLTPRSGSGSSSHSTRTRVGPLAD